MNAFLARISPIALTFVAFSVSSCETRTTSGFSDADTMTRALQSALPIGTNLPIARTFMEREGFRCTPQTDARWLDRTHLDYLYCERSDGSIVQRRWQVAIVHVGNGVSEILVTTGLVGP
jgi:hypothetical protein